ncbi:sensor histidine kinase [Clostridium butyricum]|uniref:VirS protein n=1 Tax=Clostridium butyricum TaxID=1492 RepID=A0A2S7FEG2_CLOBU|nr:GHKL domain-containing protein [Clostridium butyricum]KHD15519.1 VirS protein [Clostridium butyricum]MBS5984245.1 GHKL domain-containing protein [Clostridium butyricum]PPV17523.1 VirS protein [Clostridium butyricum]
MRDKKISILEKYHTKIVRIVIAIFIVGIATIPVNATVRYFLINEYGKYEIFMSLIAAFEIIIFIYLFKVIIINNKLSIDKFQLTKKLMCISVIIDYFFIGFLKYDINIGYKSIYFAIVVALFLDIKMTIKTNVALSIITIFIYTIESMIMNRPSILSSKLIIDSIIILGLMTILTTLVYFAERILLEEEIKEMKYKEDYYNRIEKKQKEIKELRHNIKNEIIMLKSQVNNGNIKEANIIMDRIISKTQNDKLGIYTDNVEINFMINSKINQSKHYNIKWNIDIKVPVNLRVDASDIGIILGNLLDNSIEACSMIEEFERIIDVTILYKKSAMTINIENSKSIYYNSEKTWKEDKENHGLGLKSVEKIANKYSGILNYEDKINRYEVNVIMWNV